MRVCHDMLIPSTLRVSASDFSDRRKRLSGLAPACLGQAVLARELERASYELDLTCEFGTNPSSLQNRHHPGTNVTRQLEFESRDPHETRTPRGVTLV